ncbi:DUF2312 domain-containing protein [Rickettsiaceae bacterium]|nr:DUF2312 domain-containing protein [Rickettsiaceae bacterium]
MQEIANSSYVFGQLFVLKNFTTVVWVIFGFAADKLQQIISKIENIEQERLESADLLKDVFNEAKSMGFDIKIIKHVLKLRKKDKDALAEEDSLIDLYRGALGV